MRDARGYPTRAWAHAWFGLTAALVALGLIIQVAVTWSFEGGHFATPLSRIFNLLFFFTILSNIITGVTNGLLYANPDRPSEFFRVVRLAGLIGIAVTGIVYHGVLAENHHLEGWSLVADVILHSLVPIAAVLGWLLFGPRGQLTPRIVALSVLFPAIYCAVTLIRGPLVGDWYPYPFIDVAANGYGRVAINCALVAVLFVGLAAGAFWVDGLLTRRFSGALQLSGR
jgi:hypothetical protein